MLRGNIQKNNPIAIKKAPLWFDSPYRELKSESPNTYLSDLRQMEANLNTY